MNKSDQHSEAQKKPLTPEVQSNPRLKAEAQTEPSLTRVQKIQRKLAFGISFFMCILFFIACVGYALRSIDEADNYTRQVEAARQAELGNLEGQENSSKKYDLQHIDASWHQLIEQLIADELYNDEVGNWFTVLPEHTAKSMHWKINELFRTKYLPKPAPQETAGKDKLEVQPYVITDENILKVIEFLENYSEAFAAAEKKYFVPKEIVASLLMVETKLGNYMGNEPAFFSLADMAAAVDKNLVISQMENLPLDEERINWIEATMNKRSAWAYKELSSLIAYCLKNKHVAADIKGSPVGAIGICQFMPSNIVHYAADGNKDGIIDLFKVEDAIHSCANYLRMHGWRKAINEEKQKSIIRRYNHSNVYVNTVYLLAEAVLEQQAKLAQEKK